jgi:hypothetical protein
MARPVSSIRWLLAGEIHGSFAFDGPTLEKIAPELEEHRLSGPAVAACSLHSRSIPKRRATKAPSGRAASTKPRARKRIEGLRIGAVGEPGVGPASVPGQVLQERGVELGEPILAVKVR